MAFVRQALCSSGNLLLTQSGQTFSNEVAEGLGFVCGMEKRIKDSDFPEPQNQIWHPKQIQFHLHQLLIDSQNQFKGSCGNQSQLIPSTQIASAQMVYNFLIFCNKLDEQRVKNMTSSIQWGVSFSGNEGFFCLVRSVLKNLISVQ